jgi:hypothetical protein
MSFIALDICGGRFAKGYGIMGVILHALSGHTNYLSFFLTMHLPNDGFRHARAFRMRTCSSALRPAPRRFPAIFRINFIADFIT